MKITILGVGRLGLGFALLLEQKGHDVVGVDVVPEYVQALNQKTFSSSEPGYTELLAKSQRFHATTSLKEGLNHSNLIFIMVQTPNGGDDKFYDHTILSNLLAKINTRKVTNKHLVISCTVMPKYIDEVGQYLLSDCEQCTVNYNPEFIAQGDIVRGYLNPDIILIGTHSKELAQMLRKVYQSLVSTFPIYHVLSPLEAEIVKISINSFITTKLSFANLISDVCDEVGADKHQVLAAIGQDTRIGTKYFKPGYSFGGPCFPRDTFAMKQFVQQSNIPVDLFRATSEYNDFHVTYMADQLLRLNQQHYTIEDVCYKEQCKVPIIEHSAKLKIALRLLAAGKKVTIKDEQLLLVEVQKKYGNIFTYEEKEGNRPISRNVVAPIQPSKRKICITGGAGFIGSHLAKKLHEQGHYVVVVDIKRNEFMTDYYDEFKRLDLRTLEACQKAVEGCDEVYHLAADMGGMGFIQSNQASLFYNNTMISFNVVEAARQAGVQTLFFSSSACCYNESLQLDPDNPGLTEDMAWPAKPQDTYGLEKLCTEEFILSYAKDYQMKVYIARFHNVYGPFGTWKGGREKAPAAFCRKAYCSNDTIEIWGDGEQTRSFMYIDDCIEGILRLTSSDFHQPVNLGSDEMISINGLVDLLSEISHKKWKKKHVKGPQGVRGRNSDNTLIQKVLGWAPSISIWQGITQTYAWISQEIFKEGGQKDQFCQSKIV